MAWLKPCHSFRKAKNDCGEATCMAFAANLLLGKRQPDECSIIETDPAFADRRSALLTIVTG